MYKLFGQDGKEKIVHTNTDKQEHIKSGYYSEKKPSGARVVGIDMSKLEGDLKSDAAKASSKPKRKGI